MVERYKDHYDEMFDKLINLVTSFGSKNGCPPIKLEIYLDDPWKLHSCPVCRIILLDDTSGIVPIGIGETHTEWFTAVRERLQEEINNILDPKRKDDKNENCK